MANNTLYPATSPYYTTGVVNGKFLDVMIDRPIIKQPSDIYWEITLVYEYRPDTLAWRIPEDSLIHLFFFLTYSFPYSG